MNKPKLFFLHFAGGNCYSYQFILPYLDKFEVIFLELPGRGKRMMEDLIKDYDNAIVDYYKQIRKRLDGSDFIIYGHSMGATLGWEVTRMLEENNIFPLSLIVSGNAGPGVGAEKKERHLLPEDMFIKELRKLGGLTEDFYENRELFEFFEPILRADFEVLEKKPIVFKSVIKTPLYALMGKEEENVQFIDNWKKYVVNSFESEIFEGDHFFIYKHPQSISGIIKKIYDKHLVQ
jgi:external thioesterase TEII